MAIAVNQQDTRYPSLAKSRNLRFPANAQQIQLCETSADVAAALQRAVDAGQRPTIRSGGHCYEDFVVNNPGGVILDLSLLTAASQPSDAGRFRISAGRQLGDAYLDLYKRYNRTIPAGSCYNVGAGGHISGGGYGLLARLQGLTVDWISAVEIITVNKQGKVETHCTDSTHEADLFRACRGAGGGNFGIITGFLFDDLPVPPKEVIGAGISFDWKDLSEERFTSILQTYGDYFANEGKRPETWGLFPILHLSHVSGGHIGIELQFCNSDGTCDDTSVLEDFLKRFDDCQPVNRHPALPHTKVPGPSSGTPCAVNKRPVRRRPWIEATIGGSGGSAGYGGARAKYKSAYMKQSFSDAEAKTLYRHLTRKDVEIRGFTLAIDAYGGKSNEPRMIAETSMPQRASIMKLQYMSFWQQPEEDARQMQFIKDLYTDVYAGGKGTPYPGDRYEGCYINYPDVDMLAYDFWPQLYYGTGDLYPFLQGVKRRYDSNNVFHHGMSIRA